MGRWGDGEAGEAGGDGEMGRNIYLSSTLFLPSIPCSLFPVPYSLFPFN